MVLTPTGTPANTRVVDLESFYAQAEENDAEGESSEEEEEEEESEEEESDESGREAEESELINGAVKSQPNPEPYETASVGKDGGTESSDEEVSDGGDVETAEHANWR